MNGSISLVQKSNLDFFIIMFTQASYSSATTKPDQIYGTFKNGGHTLVDLP